MRLVMAALVAAALAGASARAAQVRDGEALLRQCTATIGAIVDFCYGYVDAVADYLFQGRSIGALSACVAQMPDDGELRFVVVRYLRANPELLSLGAPELIARALAARFPCP